MISLSCFESKTLIGIDDRQNSDDAAIAFDPSPWKRHEKAALAGHFIQIAADIFNTWYTAFNHQGLVGRFPIREIFLGIPSGGFLVFLDQVGLGRSKAVVHQLGSNGMVICLASVPHAFHLLVHQPLSAGTGYTATVGEVFVAVRQLR